MVKGPNNSQAKAINARLGKTASTNLRGEINLKTLWLAAQVTMSGVTRIIPSPSAAHHTHHVFKNGAPKASADTPAPNNAVTPLLNVATPNRTITSIVRPKVIFDLQNWVSTHAPSSGSSVFA